MKQHCSFISFISFVHFWWAPCRSIAHSLWKSHILHYTFLYTNATNVDGFSHHSKDLYISNHLFTIFLHILYIFIILIPCSKFSKCFPNVKMQLSILRAAQVPRPQRGSRPGALSAAPPWPSIRCRVLSCAELWGIRQGKELFLRNLEKLAFTSFTLTLSLRNLDDSRVF